MSSACASEEALELERDFLNKSQEILECLSNGVDPPFDWERRLRLPASAETPETRLVREMIKRGVETISSSSRPSSSRYSLSPRIADISPTDIGRPPRPVLTSTPMTPHTYSAVRRRPPGRWIPTLDLNDSDSDHGYDLVAEPCAQESDCNCRNCTGRSSRANVRRARTRHSRIEYMFSWCRGPTRGDFVYLALFFFLLLLTVLIIFYMVHLPTPAYNGRPV